MLLSKNVEVNLCCNVILLLYKNKHIIVLFIFRDAINLERMSSYYQSIYSMYFLAVLSIQGREHFSEIFKIQVDEIILP